MQEFLQAFPAPFVFVFGVFIWLLYQGYTEKSKITKKVAILALTATLCIAMICTYINSLT
jgi:hypothetical protein